MNISDLLSNDKLKFERIKQMPRLKAEIISYLFDQVGRRKRDTWWQYKGNFMYEGNEYELECDCKYDNQMFTYKNLHISHKTIEIDIEDYFKKGKLS